MREETHQLSNTVAVKETTLSGCIGGYLEGRGVMVSTYTRLTGLNVCVCV